jgi:dihydroxy-acid dehydratase
MRELLEAGLLHGECLTVTGRTMAENLAALDPPAPDGTVIHRLSEPIHADGGIAVLTGSLAPKGSVVKVAGIDTPVFSGPARVFDGEQGALDAILAGSIEPGTVVVIRYAGAETVPSSPTAASRGGPTASVSATWPPRPSTADPSPSWPTGTRS